LITLIFISLGLFNHLVRLFQLRHEINSLLVILRILQLFLFRMAFPAMLVSYKKRNMLVQIVTFFPMDM